MKIKVLEKVPKNKIGHLDKSKTKPEPHEENTAKHLIQFGIDVEFIRPSNTYKTNSADVFMLGAIWEMKAPITYKESTIKGDFRKAKHQSDRIIFDLRRVKKHSKDVEKYIIKIFEQPGFVRKLIIIEKDGKTFELSK